MGKTFARVRLCHTNDFAPNKNDKIKQWVENNGGTYQTEIAFDTTHLLCSLSAWRNYHEIVRQARRQNRGLLEKKKIKIVRFGWLEDSLLSKSRKPKATTMYEFEQRNSQQHRTDVALGHQTQAQRVRAIEPIPHAFQQDRKNFKLEHRQKRVDQAMKEFDAACVEFEADMGEAGYHPYSDRTAFVYLIVLARHDVLKNSIERHRLKLFESDSIPHRYACYTAYTNGKPGFQKVSHTLAEPGSSWDFAWGMFRRVFQLKTGVEWASRPEVATKMDTKQQNGPGNFKYIVPGKGEPQGYRYGLANNSLAESGGVAEGGGNESVTMLVLPIEADTKGWEEGAKTPKGGW